LRNLYSLVGEDGPSSEAVFEVIIDGKTIIGKKKTKLLKVSSRMSSSVGDDEGGSSSIMESGDKKKKDGSGANGRNMEMVVEQYQMWPPVDVQSL
jgi:hypothetical protein